MSTTYTVHTVLKSMAIIVFTLSFIIRFWKLVVYTQTKLKKYLNWIASHWEETRNDHNSNDDDGTLIDAN